jgi:hypothetical protein
MSQFLVVVEHYWNSASSKSSFSLPSTSVSTVHLDILDVNCIVVSGYIARGYTVAMHYCTMAAHCFTVAALG